MKKTPAEPFPCGCVRSTATGIQYQGTREDYDGVSEWRCACGKRWGRWTDKRLIDGELEKRYGRG